MFHCWSRVWVRRLKFREVKKHAQSHTARKVAEAVGKSRVRPGRHGFTLQGGVLALSLSCCVTLSKLSPLSELHLLAWSEETSKTTFRPWCGVRMAMGKTVLAPSHFSLSPISKTSGNFELNVEGVSISAGLRLGQEPASGRLTASCSSCSSNIDGVRLHVSGSSLGYDLPGLWMGGRTSRRTVPAIPGFRKHTPSATSLPGLVQRPRVGGRGQDSAEGAHTVRLEELLCVQRSFSHLS